MEDEEIKRWIINELKVKHHYLNKDNVDFVDKAIAWLESKGKQKSIYNKESRKFEFPNIKINDAVEVSSRMKYIDDDLKPIAEFILNYADWNLDKDEWNQPTITVPVFRVLDALITRGQDYCDSE